MQLKIQRSQRQTGVVSKAVVFCVDARIFFSAEEQANVQRYKLGSQVIYSSQAARRSVENAQRRVKKGEAYGEAAHELGRPSAFATGMGHYAVGMIHSIAARMALNITVDSLQRGQHIECKDLDEVIDAEEALMQACQNLKGYLQTAATFDGREVVIDFAKDEPEVVSTPVALAAPVAPAPIVQPTPTDFVAPSAPVASTAAVASPALSYGYTMPPPATPNPFQPALDWWNKLTNEQRKWMMIVGGVVALFILYEIL